MKTNRFIENYKNLLNDNLDNLLHVTRNKQLCDLLIYCIDRKIKINKNIIDAYLLNETLVPSFYELRSNKISDKNNNHFIWVESENGCPFGGVEEGYWVWHEDCLKLVDFLIYYVRDKLIEVCLSYGLNENQIVNETISSLCEILSNKVNDNSELGQLTNVIYYLYESCSYDAIKYATFKIEHILRTIDVDIRIFSFKSLIDARALLYAHGNEYETSSNYNELFSNDELN